MVLSTLLPPTILPISYTKIAELRTPLNCLQLSVHSHKVQFCFFVRICTYCKRTSTNIVFTCFHVPVKEYRNSRSSQIQISALLRPYKTISNDKVAGSIRGAVEYEKRHNQEESNVHRARQGYLQEILVLSFGRSERWASSPPKRQRRRGDDLIIDLQGVRFNPWVELKCVTFCKWDTTRNEICRWRSCCVEGTWNFPEVPSFDWLVAILHILWIRWKQGRIRGL